jgi:hypothetical protein
MEMCRRDREWSQLTWLVRDSLPFSRLPRLQSMPRSSFCRQGLESVRQVDVVRRPDGRSRQRAFLRRELPEPVPAGRRAWWWCAASLPGLPPWQEHSPLDQPPAIPSLPSRRLLRRSAARCSARLFPVSFRQPCCLNTMDE